MRRPEFKIKFDLAGLYHLSQAFPGQSSMWQMTAAQRSLMLGPAKGKDAGKRPTKRLSREEMEARTAKRTAKKDSEPRKRIYPQGVKPPIEDDGEAPKRWRRGDGVKPKRRSNNGTAAATG